MTQAAASEVGDALSHDALPAAWGAPVLTAAIRTTAEDFVVEEIDGFDATGIGEHLLLTVQKRGMNTSFAAKRIAGWAGLDEMAVGYAGMKDRHAVTTQRFSVHLPKRTAPDIATLEEGADALGHGQSLRVLSHTWHAKKRPRGALAGNRVALALRDVVGDRAAIEERLHTIAEAGVPNYFGEQRFGRDGGNVAGALAMFGGKRLRRDQRTLLLSAARSALFNRVLAARVVDGSWNRPLNGEVWLLDGSRSVFGPEPWSDALSERLARFDIHPSAPLWGRGARRCVDAARAVEDAALDDPTCHRLQAGLEAAGLKQERRATRLRPESLQWDWLDDGALRLTFALPPGAYATTLLAALGDVRDAAGEGDGRSSDAASRSSASEAGGV